MKLKTYHAPTMAEALAAVRKDLGPEAMILHTRSYRVGSWLGFGGKNMVEITASASEPDRKARSRPAQAAPAAVARHEATADDRSAVLGGETLAARAASRAPARDHAEVVVQRAAAIVEPKPILTRPARDAARDSGRDAVREIERDLPSREVAPRDIPRDSTARPETSTPRAGIATRLPNNPDRPPVRIADATPSPDLDRPRHTVPPAPIPEARPAAVAPAPAAPSQDAAALQDQIATLQKMMGQVLESTRRTSVAMGKVDPRAAEAVEPGPLLNYTNKLVDNETPMAVVDRIISRVRDRLDQAELRDDLVVRQAVLREIEASIDTRSDSLLAISAGTKTGRPRVISLIGPTGVGKTTTVAKVAATCKLRHARRVGLITSDTYRIAAVEQLRTYAGIIGLPIKVVMSPEEMSAAIADMAGMDVIIVDTAGRSQHDARRLDELKQFIDAARPDETHLVLSATVGNTVMERTAERFKPLGPDRVILTKLDEAVCTGGIAGLTGRIGLPLSFVTVGQEVPDDIEPARADRLARVVLDGPAVVCRGSDGRD